MFLKFLNFVQIKELRGRILRTVALLAICRAGVFLTIPGIDRRALRDYMTHMRSEGEGFFGIFNFFSGGAIENASILALGIMPYITASIIVSVMSGATDYLEKLQKEGESGRKRINQYTRYGAIGIALAQGAVIAKYLKAQTFEMQPLVNQDWAFSFRGFGFTIITMLTLTAGTAFVMWLSEIMTEVGVGNGVSLIIFSGIVARLPSVFYSLFIGLKSQVYDFSEIVILFFAMLLILAGIVFVEKSQRRIPIQHMRTTEKGEGTIQATYLPLKINLAGVIPPIFASTVLMAPSVIFSFLETEWSNFLKASFGPGNWRYQFLYFLLIIFFSYFYISMQFNFNDISENIRKSGGYVPGIRPGAATAEYIRGVLNRIAFGGSIYLSLVCILPILIQEITSNKTPFYFGGTGLLIVVGVALETFQQIEGHFIEKQYDSMFEKNRLTIRARRRSNNAS